MSDLNFKDIVCKQYDARIKATAPIKEVDAYVFCTSSKYLGEHLFPWQSLAVKVIYSLWQKYPITDKEQEIIDILKEVWHINLDLENRDPRQVVEILILVFGRRCLKETERVLDPGTGERIAIKDLYARQVGQILTLDSAYKLHKAAATEIFDNGEQECFKITTRTGRTISATANHPFLTIAGWKWLGELKVGDRIAVPRKLNVIGKEILPDNEVRLLGFFTGGGHTVNKCNFTNTTSAVCRQFENDIYALSPELKIRQYGIDRSIVQFEQCQTSRKETVVQKFVKLHKLWGKHSWEKTVPEVIFKSTNRQIALFLNSLYACDGWVDTKSIGYTTTSKVLAEDLQHLLLRFGINAAIRSRRMLYKDSGGKKVSCRIAYRLEVTSTEDINVFATKINILGKEDQVAALIARKGPRKYHNTQAYSIPQKIWQRIKAAIDQTNLKVGKVWKGKSVYRSSQYSPNRAQVKRFGELLNDQELYNLDTSDVYWEPIKSIEYDGKHQTYDLTVPDTHNFVCEDIITHNSGKSSFISFIQTYEAYKLICKGDPQRYYGIRARHPIWIVNTAKDGEQAQDPFRLCKENIRRIPFFQKYIDWSKDNESEMRLFTPADLYENAQIKKYNETRSKGAPKKSLQPGTIMIAAFTTTAASKRGKAIIMLILDEFAHFDRAKTSGGGLTEEDILAEMPQTDYAMLKALSPATKDFNIKATENYDGDPKNLWYDADSDENYLIYDGKIIMISSPKEKGGEFYKHYCLAGGMEQANPQRPDRRKNFLLMQMSSWECNPKYTRKSFASDYQKDPTGANMEFGGHFGEPSTTFIDASKVDAMVDLKRPMSYVGKQFQQYIISIDPASKGDTYAICWGHMENDTILVDGIHGFRPDIVSNDATGQIIRVPVNPNKVVGFIKALAYSLSLHGTLLEIVFDQWSSQDSILALKQEGYVAVETFFTNKYKNVMYTNFLEKLNIGKIRTFGRPPLTQLDAFPEFQQGWLDQTKLELKYLNRITSGNTVYYAAPTTGPIQTDDFPDALANLTHRLMMYASGDPGVYKDIYKQTGKPVKRPTSFKGKVTRNPFSIGRNKIDRLQQRVRGN